MKKKIAFAFLFAVMVVGVVKVAKAQGVLGFGEICLVSNDRCAPDLICKTNSGIWGVCVFRNPY